MQLQSRLEKGSFIWDGQGPLKIVGSVITEEGGNGYNFMGHTFCPQTFQRKFIFSNVLDIVDFLVSQITWSLKKKWRVR